MNKALWIVLVGLALPLYSYLAYPAILFVLSGLIQLARDARYLVSRNERRSRSSRLPSVSIIISAFNEEQVIARTLSHCLELDYPQDRLEIVLGSDGSTDRTVQIAENCCPQRVRVLDFRQRRGKVAVISDCVEHARGDIVVFTDANTALRRDSVRKLIRHFDYPDVGAVCGELRLVSAEGQPMREGLYWRYEMVLKILESRLRAVLGANGGIYALRRELFPSVNKNLITDDFVIPMKVRAQGHRVVYDPEAIAVEEAPPSMSAEFRRRLRIGAGNWQALRHCAELLLPTKGFVAFAFWSHKVIRWFTPFLLVLAFFANVLLLSSPIGQVTFSAQMAFYATAVLGYALQGLRLPAGPLGLVSYFVTINAALAMGFARGAVGAQQAAWHRTKRDPVAAREEQ